MTDCQSFASYFNLTCDDPTVDLLYAAVPTELMECEDVSYCYQGLPVGTCEFSRKLCASCSEDLSGNVYIRVQTNTLPDHCMNLNNYASPHMVDFKVLYNTDVH